MKDIKSSIILKNGTQYFDWTASGLAHKGVEERMLEVLQTYSNTHSECGANAKATGELYEFARRELKRLLGLGDEFYLLGTGFGSTGAIKKFCELAGIYISPMLKKRLFSSDELWQKAKQKAPLIITGPYEHHSNELHFRYEFCHSIRVRLDENGGFDFDDFARILRQNKSREIIISVSAASNVTGVKTDTKKLRELTNKLAPKAIIALDASSIIAHENIPSQHFDALFISSHKLLGGVGGCGLLALRKSVAQSFSASGEPSFAAGGVVEYVSRSSARFNSNFEALEDAGTPPITQMIRAYLAFKERNDFGLENIKKRENELMEYFEAGLAKINHIINYTPLGRERVGIYAINCDLAGCYDFAKMLSQNYEIQVRAGCSCAGPYGHELLGLDDDFEPYFKPGWVRVSLHYSQDFSDIDYLLKAIESCVEEFLR